MSDMISSKKKTRAGHRWCNLSLLHTTNFFLLNEKKLTTRVGAVLTIQCRYSDFPCCAIGSPRQNTPLSALSHWLRTLIRAHLHRSWLLSNWLPYTRAESLTVPIEPTDIQPCVPGLRGSVHNRTWLRFQHRVQDALWTGPNSMIITVSQLFWHVCLFLFKVYITPKIFFFVFLSLFDCCQIPGDPSSIQILILQSDYAKQRSRSVWCGQFAHQSFLLVDKVGLLT